MTTKVSEPVPGSDMPEDEAPARKDVQREALRELVELATQCAAEESELDRRRQTEVESARRQLDKGRKELVQRHEAEETETRTRHAAEAEAIETKAQNDAAALKSTARASKRKVEADHEPKVAKVTEKLEHDMWMADSVFEVSQNQVREVLRTAHEENEKYVGENDEALTRGKTLLGKYHLSIPPQPDIETTAPENVDAVFASGRDKVEAALSHLRRLMLPNLFVGAWPYLAMSLLLVVGGIAGYFAMNQSPAGGIIGAVAAMVVGLGLGWVMFITGKKQAQQSYQALLAAVLLANKAAEIKLLRVTEEQDKKLKETSEKRKQEISRARERVAPILSNAEKQRDADLATIESHTQQRLARLTAAFDKSRAETRARHQQEDLELTSRHGQEAHDLQARHDEQVRLSQERFDTGRAALEARWSEGLTRIFQPISDAGGKQAFPSWDDPVWQNWDPPKTFPPAVRFGQLQVDLHKVIDAVPREGKFTLPVPETFDLPALLSFPQSASLLIEAQRTGRDEALRAIQMAMVRLLTTVPPGRVHFTIIDPVGLGQNFAGFMHLADYDEALVGTRIWTDAEQIEQRLGDLTEHMETVIQKYLRNEYETIDEYNAQAGELAEPYRFLVVADFPVRFEGESYRRLNSIATSGARCGVYTLIMRDMRVPLPAGTHLDDVESHSVTLVQNGEDAAGRPLFSWKDEVFNQFPLQVDKPPTEEFLTTLLNDVGRRAKESKRVELSFETIAPKPPEFWSLSTREELRVPIGRMGATRQQMLRLGKGVAQHALIAGKTGSGKSTLLHALITNLAMWYSPSEVEFYLVDFKKGVEFKTYATHHLPHARVIAVESDREFGLSVLQRLDAELARRGNLYRKAGVQDLNAYRRTPNAEVMPRTLLIVDEFQEFFSEDDKLAQDASLLIDRLVRQGRAFGMHILLGSQTIGGAGGLSRSTLGQMAVRVALQLSEADSQMILGDNNSAARLLTRPGEAIYNDAGGLVENNSPFQIAWLSDDKKDKYLEQVSRLSENSNNGHAEPLVFEGNAPADITKNVNMERLIAASAWEVTNAAPQAWLGDPVAIKDATAVTFRRQSGSNAMLVGQAEEGAMALLAASTVGLSLQLPPDRASFWVFDGSPSDSPLAQVFPRVKQSIPHEVRLVEYRLVAEAIAELGIELKRRQDEGLTGAPAIFIMLYGLQRYRALRKSEDSSFSFGGGDADKPPAPDKVFGDLIREGPTFGIHLLIWVDTPVSIDRTFERGIMREFDNRILFQMSASDSSTLIDSPAANKLGPYRALSYSEEQGTMEKFRPYAVTSKDYLSRVAAAMAARKPV